MAINFNIITNWREVLLLENSVHNSFWCNDITLILTVKPNNNLVPLSWKKIRKMFTLFGLKYNELTQNLTVTWWDMQVSKENLQNNSSQ